MLFFILILRFEQQRAEGWTDGQCRHGRQSHRGRHDNTELHEEGTGGT